MKKTIKKLAAFAVAISMIAAMSAVSFAAPSINPLKNASSFTFEKDLKGINDSIGQVDGPGVTFDYTIASVIPAAENGGTSVTNGANTAVVTAGPASGLVFHGGTHSISYPKGTLINSAASAGASNKKELTVDVDLTKYSEPGIYRYSISENTDPAASNLPAGFTNTASQVRYVDVYVINNGTSGLECSGMVMHDGATSNGSPSNKATFNAASYQTKNVAVKKVVTGAMADSNAEFAFTATVSNNSRSFFTGSSEAGASTQKSTTPATADLGNNDELWLCGLSMDATVGFSEVNTYGGNTYIAQYKLNNGENTAGNQRAAANLNENDMVTFTNTLNSVTPTGVIMRYGPYIGMFLIALMLFTVYKRTRKSNNAI